MIITAKASHISHSPRKINLVAASIVGLKADAALEKLSFTIKRASHPVSKVLKQAIANATNNYKMDPKSLVVSEAFATKGRVLKRALVGGRSRQKPYERVASHLTINLKTIEAKVAPKATPKAEVKEIKEVKELKAAPKKTVAKKVSTNKTKK